MSTSDEALFRRDYLIAEYNALVGKMDRAARDLHVVEVTFAAAIGVFDAWVLKNGASVASTGRWVLAIPIVLAVLGASRI